MKIIYKGESKQYVTEGDLEGAIKCAELKCRLKNKRASEMAGKDIEPYEIAHITFDVKDEYLTYGVKYMDNPFFRIRRITGYLTGSLDRFNDAKRAEERDRVKHSV